MSKDTQTPVMRIDKSIAEVEADTSTTEEQRRVMLNRLYQWRAMCQALVDSRHVILKVGVDNLDQAEQIYSWFSDKNEAMDSTLQLIDTDAEIVSGSEAKLVKHIRRFINESNGTAVGYESDVSGVIQAVKTHLDSIGFLETDVAAEVVQNMLNDIIDKLRELE